MSNYVAIPSSDHVAIWHVGSLENERGLALAIMTADEAKELGVLLIEAAYHVRECEE